MSTSTAIGTAAIARRRGRPRHTRVASSLSPREEILDIAARLFVARGYAATSTREIAEAVGIRQASNYYHFPSGKEEILSELLARTVRPTLDTIDQIEQAVPHEVPGAAVYLLAITDVGTLARAPHNIGLLARLPDVIRATAGREHAAHRQDLREAYARLASNTLQQTGSSEDAARIGDLILQFVESVVGTRADGRDVADADAVAIATSCLHLCGLDTDAITHTVQIAQTCLPLS